MGKVELRYLSIFRDDLVEAVRYIRDTLQNPKAANDLIDDVEMAILARCENPESYEQYKSPKEHMYPYYRIHVNNYVIYYVVIPGEVKTMEIRRFLYNKRNRTVIV